MTNRQLQIAVQTKNAALTKEQKRFNRLIGRIAAARTNLAAWQDAIPQFGQAYVDRVLPLQEKLAAGNRAWALALDRVLRGVHWSRPDGRTLRQLISEMAAHLLGQTPDDAELRALFERHSGVDYDTARREDLAGVKGLAELMTGLDLGDDDIASDDELLQRMQDGMAAQEGAEAEAAAPRAHSRQDAARQKRRDAEAARVTQSVRDVYRRLVSALHPDREPDEALRREKTAMMQKINHAYATNDLLTLLEAQLQIEQADTAAHRADAGRLKRYNQVLTEQIQQLDLELERVQFSFCMDYGMDPMQRVSPNRMGALIEEQVHLLRASIAEQAVDMRRLSDGPGMRRWLKQQRRQMDAPPSFEDFF